MTEDPIVQELRAAREEFARENGYGLRRIAAALKALDESDTTRQMIRLPPQPVVSAASGPTPAPLPAVEPVA